MYTHAYVSKLSLCGLVCVWWVKFFGFITNHYNKIKFRGLQLNFTMQCIDRTFISFFITVNQSVGCLLCSMAISMIYGMGLWTSARCVVRSLVLVRMAIELKYRNTPSIHIDNNILSYVIEKIWKIKKESNYIPSCENIRLGNVQKNPTRFELPKVDNHFSMG